MVLVEIAQHVLVRVVPQQQDLGLDPDSLDLLMHELDDLYERPTRDQSG